MNKGLTFGTGQGMGTGTPRTKGSQVIIDSIAFRKTCALRCDRAVMRVLLINPEFPDTYWSFRHALPFEGKRCAFPPLGLMTVSALLPRSWERRLIDLNVRRLRSSDMKRYSAMSVQYSRGCPFNCEFCDIIEIYGRVPRTKSNQQMLTELDALRDLGWQGTVFIVDDNFIGNKKNVRRLLPELANWQKRHGYPFTLITEASVNLAEDEPLLDSMRSAGFSRVFLGIETPVEESLKEAQKSQNRGNLLDSVKKIQSYGMEVMGGFIVGFDNDPEDIFERQIKFIRESAIPLAMVGILTALPDTQLWRRLKQEGRLLNESSGNNTNCQLNFVPKMDPARLIAGYQSIMRTIYESSEYYQRALDSMKRTPQDCSEPKPFGIFSGAAALIRIAVKLGLLDRDAKSSGATLLIHWSHTVTD